MHSLLQTTFTRLQRPSILPYLPTLFGLSCANRIQFHPNSTVCEYWKANEKWADDIHDREQPLYWILLVWTSQLFPSLTLLLTAVLSIAPAPHSSKNLLQTLKSRSFNFFCLPIHNTPNSRADRDKIFYSPNNIPPFLTQFHQLPAAFLT